LDEEASVAESIPEEVASGILAKCGRHCCICRSFRPTMIQVHHINEVSKGGSNDPDNLIAVCLTCHSDVHTRRPFARRFTVAELRQHRDNLYRLIAEGKLIPPNESFPNMGLDPERTVAFVKTSAFQMEHPSVTSLNRDSIELLIAASADRGYLLYAEHFGGTNISAGKLQINLSNDDHRTTAQYKHALEELERSDLIKEVNNGVFRITHEGYLAADEIEAASKTDVPIQ
jgi:hypothetical protein